MQEVETFINDVRKKVSTLKSDREIVHAYIESFLNTDDMRNRYPTLSVLLFEKNNSILSEDKYPDSYVIDYRFQWLVSNRKNEESLFDATEDINEVHYCQIHLYLYYHSERVHTPAKLTMFEFLPENTDTILEKIKAFVDQLEEKTNQTEFLGHLIAYTDAM
jgi:hypothetical protein